VTEDAIHIEDDRFQVAKGNLNGHGLV